ncbi:hypothetical protein KHS38_12560 [Mucilaginibacter sp. Bleaf8]|uniref:hypothetical protein n=1 Tax=Mucilaginibacter sp. Bleaf8 TaxID=2834430 RepID=UPI001BCEEE0C|nr:hypothetical protein [Mucilaginibacter sp. Bleaf8]MBS7565237.1 hypothetical protein [Mucilaginibacter sp. Bleaf8]
MKISIIAILLIITSACTAQQLLSYDDFTFILTNNLQRDDAFIQSKGYVPIVTKKQREGHKKYTLQLPNGYSSEVEIRADGKRLNINIFTDYPDQYNLVTNSIAPYVLSKESNEDILSYRVKDLGNIYVVVTDKAPYNPLRKDYAIRIVADKDITANN